MTPSTSSLPSNITLGSSLATSSSMTIIHYSGGHYCSSQTSRLPNEILRIIFCFAAWPSHLSVLDINTAQDTLRTSLDISHVCKLWREICVGTREIWSQCFQINLRKKMMKLVLSRVQSKDQRKLRFLIPKGLEDYRFNTQVPVWPSAMDAFETRQGEEPILDKALETDASELDAALSMDDAQFVACPRMRKSLPFFEMLKLTLYDTIPGVAGLRFKYVDGATLYDSLNPNAPRPWNLRSLELSRCFFHLDPTYLANLEELAIGDIVGIPNVQMTPLAWITTLSSLPNLRTLSLVNALTGSSTDVDLRVPVPSKESGSDLNRIPKTEILNLRNVLVISSFDEYRREFVHRLSVSSTCVVEARSA